MIDSRCRLRSSTWRVAVVRSRSDSIMASEICFSACSRASATTRSAFLRALESSSLACCLGVGAHLVGLRERLRHPLLGLGGVRLGVADEALGLRPRGLVPLGVLALGGLAPRRDRQLGVGQLLLRVRGSARRRAPWPCDVSSAADAAGLGERPLDLEARALAQLGGLALGRGAQLGGLPLGDLLQLGRLARRDVAQVARSPGPPARAARSSRARPVARRSAAYRSASPRSATTVCSVSARAAASSSAVVGAQLARLALGLRPHERRVLLGLDAQRGDLGRDALLERGTRPARRRRARRPRTPGSAARSEVTSSAACWRAAATSAAASRTLLRRRTGRPRRAAAASSASTRWRSSVVSASALWRRSCA